MSVVVPAIRMAVIDDHRLFAGPLIALLEAPGDMSALGYGLTIRDGIGLGIAEQPDP